MRHLRKILLIVQVVALILYPIAAIGSAPAVAQSDEFIIAESHHAGGGTTESHHVSGSTHNSQHDCASNHINELIAHNTSGSIDFNTAPCCHIGVAGLSAILSSAIPEFPPLIHGGEEARLQPFFMGLHPSLLPHPPKTSS